MPARAAFPAHTATVFCAAVPFVRGGSAAALPQRLKILSWGENFGRTTKARIVVGEKTLACLSANQVATACERVPMDYEHQSVKDHPHFVPDPRPVPGHGEIEIVANDGVYLSAIDYTPNGLEYAANYQDVSAVCYIDADNNLLFIRSVALTQHGDVAGMEFAESVAASAQFSPTNPTHSPTTMLDYKALLLTRLGLADDASDENITAALAADDTATSAALAATAATAAAAAAEGVSIAALTADFNAFRRQAAIDKAIAQGKTIPLSDSVLAGMPYAALTAMLDGLQPGTVATAASAATTEQLAAREVALSAEQSAAAKALGLTAAEYRAALS